MIDVISSKAASESMYRKLDASRQEIRLLKLHPSSDREGQVQCSLKIVSLYDNPVFEALSYAWGDATMEHEIQVNGVPFQTTASASSALKALRYQEDRRVLWIDAICIDQSNLNERSEQVKLMGIIYRKAESVRVWLGPEEIGDEGILRLLRGIQSEKEASDVLGSTKSQYGLIVNKILYFLARNWWERLWVVQEVVLGQHVMFQIGTETVEFAKLYRAFWYCLEFFKSEYISSDTSRIPFQRLRAPMYLGILRKNYARDNCAHDGGSTDTASFRKAIMSWATTANYLRGRKASDDRDKVFALLGLLPTEFIARSEMKASYTSSARDTYIDITYNIISSSKSLMIFDFTDSSEASNPGRSLKLPSWVPDWGIALTDEVYGSHLRLQRENLFCPSGATPFHLQRLGLDTLCLKGIFFDIVEQSHSSSLDTSENVSNSWSPIHSQWRSAWAAYRGLPIERAMNQRYLPGIDISTAFQRTMVYDTEPEPPWANHFERLSVDGFNRMSFAHDNSSKAEVQHGSGSSDLSQKPTRLQNFMSSCVGGQFFIITMGGLMGLGTVDLKFGDHIFVAAGNSHPIILRPSKEFADTWHAVGECYITGIMDGELLQSKKHFSDYQKRLYGLPEVQSLKGIKRNPAWDELSSKPEDPWEWLLVQ